MFEKEKAYNMLCLLDEEQMRVKSFLNDNNLDCTTAAYVIVKEYRTKLKDHIKILKENL